MAAGEEDDLRSRLKCLVHRSQFTKPTAELREEKELVILFQVAEGCGMVIGVHPSNQIHW